MQGAIPDSQNIPMNQLPAVMERLREHGQVVPNRHSRSRSEQACAYPVSRGLDNMLNLRAGITAWAQSGYALG